MLNEDTLSMLKLTRPLICFDLETTGVDPEGSRILEIAAIKVYPSGRGEKIREMFNPGFSIPKSASAVHGITDDDVEDMRPFEAHAKELKSFFEGCDLTGYNIVKFDVPCLKAEFNRAGIVFNTDSVKLIDTYSIVIRQQTRDLSWATKFYIGEELDNAHTAMADTTAALSILYAQIKEYIGSQASIEDVDKLQSDPNWVDPRGCLIRHEGKILVNFGKHAGKELLQVPISYLNWMRKSNFDKDVIKAVNECINGR